jgi:hypothetical protein
LGYGYRSMKADEVKGYTMEVAFDTVGCELVLFAGDIWHCHRYKITFKELGEWHISGKYPGAIGWLRSEFVRQVLELPEDAEAMPHSGPREWTPKTLEWTKNPVWPTPSIKIWVTNPLFTFLAKWSNV